MSREKAKADDWVSEWELVEDTPGIAKWRIPARREDEPAFLVSLLGATVSKMAELHRRPLTLDDFHVGVRRAIARERGRVERKRREGEEPPDVVEVMVRDSDLAELDGKVVGPTNNTPS